MFLRFVFFLFWCSAALRLSIYYVQTEQNCALCMCDDDFLLPSPVFSNACPACLPSAQEIPKRPSVLFFFLGSVFFFFFFSETTIRSNVRHKRRVAVVASFVVLVGWLVSSWFIRIRPFGGMKPLMRRGNPGAETPGRGREYVSLLHCHSSMLLLLFTRGYAYQRGGGTGGRVIVGRTAPIKRGVLTSLSRPYFFFSFCLFLLFCHGLPRKEGKLAIYTANIL